MLDRVLAHRTRFPSFVNRAIDAVADDPMGPLGRLAARRMGRPGPDDTTPVAVPPPGAELSVLVAPVNYSGQGRLWAQALETADPRIGAVNLALDVPGGFSFPADLVVPVPVYHNGIRWQRQQLAAAERFSHVLVEAEEPIVGRLLGRDVRREVDQLIAAGVDVAFMCHGTDIRLPSRHRASTPWSPYRDRQLYTDRLERLSSRHRELIERSGRPAFVSTPDLLADLPGAVWCPVVVDPAAWATPVPAVETGHRPLRVVHTPSSGLVKGTQLIEPVLHALETRGVIEYRRVEGVPSVRMPEVFAGADVVLDQFRLGSYGVAACEAMAAGRLVIGHVLDDVRAIVEHATGQRLPVVEATPDTLEDVLLRIASDRGELATARERGMDFISAVHDGALSARILLDEWITRPDAATERTTAP